MPVTKLSSFCNGKKTYQVLKPVEDSIMNTKLLPGFNLYCRKFKVALIVQRFSSHLSSDLGMSGIFSDSLCTKIFKTPLFIFK